MGHPAERTKDAHAWRTTWPVGIKSAIARVLEGSQRKGIG